MDLATLLAELGTDLIARSDEELAELRANISAACREAGAGVLTPEVNAQIAEGVNAVKAIKAEEAARAAAAAEVVAQADALLSELAAEDGETEETADTETAAAEGEAAEETADTETAATEPEPEPAGVTAAAPVRRPVRVPARHQPREDLTAAMPNIVASGSVRGVAVGHQFGDLDEAYRAIHDTWFALRGSIDGVDHNVLMIDYRHLFPPELTMTSDPWENSGKMQAHVNRMRGESLTAAGGVPGPGQPRYDLVTYGTADRPIRDALPTFLAPRGIVNWNVSPTIDDFVVDTSNAAINFASSATDVSGGSYKTVQEISAVTPASATVEAQYARLQHGNFADKFLPELMAAWMKNLQVRYARHNDARRLAEISAGSTHYTDTPAVYGAYRDLKRQVYGITEEMEDHLRDENLPIRILMPAYVPAMLAVDMIAQAPGDEAYKITEDAMAADMQSWDPNVHFTFFKDGSQTNQRLLTSATANGRTPGFDADIDWYCFPEGTWAFLDGGTLDLGIVRDSTLNAQNRFQTFSETWEVAAKFGPFSYRVTSSLCANGSSQAASAINKCSPQGS